MSSLHIRNHLILELLITNICNIIDLFFLHMESALFILFFYFIYIYPILPIYYIFDIIPNLLWMLDNVRLKIQMKVLYIGEDDRLALVWCVGWAWGCEWMCVSVGMCVLVVFIR